MSCRRVSRELLERFRFGEELDAECDANLAHLERCADCQHEVAVDRAVARDLRRALRERVDGFEPSPAVWRAVRLQAADPEPPGRFAGSMVLVSGLARVMMPVAAVVLAVVLSWSAQTGLGDGADGPPDLASHLQWDEQLSSTAEVEDARHKMPEVIPAPSIQLPRPSRDTPYADTPTAIKIFVAQVPSAGGVIR